MAERRMFAKTIIDSDAFLDMSATARLLYYDLGMRADDDGFVNNPKKIMRETGAALDDMKSLCENKFIIPFENGIVVIKHWKIHNYIRKDTYVETKYKEQKALLELDENKSYRFPSTDRQRIVDATSTQDSIGKDRKGKDKKTYGDYGHVTLTDEEHKKLIDEYGEQDAEQAITFLDEYTEYKGYKHKNSYLAIKHWVMDAIIQKRVPGKAPAQKPDRRGASRGTDYNALVVSEFLESEGIK